MKLSLNTIIIVIVTLFLFFVSDANSLKVKKGSDKN